MEPTRDDQLLPTLGSLWSAMLGSAVGALVGVVGPFSPFTAVVALCVGFIASVLINLLFLVLFHVTSAFTQLEFDETPIGCSASDTLSGSLGALGGLGGALVVAALPLKNSATDPQTFFVCWSVSALIPLLGTLLLLVYAHQRNRR